MIARAIVVAAAIGAATVGMVGPGAGSGDRPAVGASGVEATPQAHTYAWPVRGPVLRPYDPPESPYAPGHRGIDIGAASGTPVHAAGAGEVAFAGWVGSGLFVSIDHPDGVRTTYSWLSSVAVRRGEHVEREALIGASGTGHPGVSPSHLHFGARIGGAYIDPLLLLERGSLIGLIHLAPLSGT